MVHSPKDTRSQGVSDPSGSDPERSDAAEEKRLAARRRFLLGGASALPVILTVAPRIPSGHPQYPSAIVGPDATVPFPKETKKLDYEVEMAMVIGKRAYCIGPEEALDHIFGFTVYNDLSARDLGEQQWGLPMLQKNLPGFAPMGPYLVTRDEIGDLDAIGLRSRVNGELRQSSSVANMRFKIPDQIAFWSQIGLEPGDVTTTGTPGGVAAGRGADEASWWLAPGDVVECEVDGVGILRTFIG